MWHCVYIPYNFMECRMPPVPNFYDIIVNLLFKKNKKIIYCQELLSIHCTHVLLVLVVMNFLHYKLVYILLFIDYICWDILSISQPSNNNLTLPYIVIYTNSIKYYSLWYAFSSNNSDDAEMLRRMRLLYYKSNRYVRMFNKCNTLFLLSYVEVFAQRFIVLIYGFNIESYMLKASCCIITTYIVKY